MRVRLHWDVLFVLEEDDLRRAPDVKHYQLAQQLRRTLVTMDRDYLDDRRFPPPSSGGVLVIHAPDERQLASAARPRRPHAVPRRGFRRAGAAAAGRPQAPGQHRLGTGTLRVGRRPRCVGIALDDARCALARQGRTIAARCSARDARSAAAAILARRRFARSSEVGGAGAERACVGVAAAFPESPAMAAVVAALAKRFAGPFVQNGADAGRHRGRRRRSVGRRRARRAGRRASSRSARTRSAASSAAGRRSPARAGAPARWAGCRSTRSSARTTGRPAASKPKSPPPASCGG